MILYAKLQYFQRLGRVTQELNPYTGALLFKWTPKPEACQLVPCFDTPFLMHPAISLFSWDNQSWRVTEISLQALEDVSLLTVQKIKIQFSVDVPSDKAPASFVSLESTKRRCSIHVDTYSAGKT